MTETKCKRQADRSGLTAEQEELEAKFFLQMKYKEVES